MNKIDLYNRAIGILTEVQALRDLLEPDAKAADPVIGWVAWTPVGYIYGDDGKVCNDISVARIYTTEEAAVRNTRMFPNGRAVKVHVTPTGWKEVDPVPATPAKVEAGAAKVETRPVFTFERGDVVTKGNTNHFLWRDGKWAYFNNAHNFVTPVVFGGGTFRSPSEVDLTNEQVVAHLNKHGWDAKFPEDTPASDSVKGERDRHGREIVNREGHAMVVRTEEDDRPYLVVDGDMWWDGIKWDFDVSKSVGCFTLDEAMTALTLAAATPLPTPSPAASEASEDITDYAWNKIGKHTNGESFLYGAFRGMLGQIDKLKEQNQSLTADLERYRVRLASLEAKLNKGNA